MIESAQCEAAGILQPVKASCAQRGEIVAEKNVPIDKGNYSLDTIERESLFEERRSEGWEPEYREYRRNWACLPEQQTVSGYPLLIDVELASICNLKCPMCYTIKEEFKKKVKSALMDFDLFKKIVDEIGGKVPALRLSLRGEPTLHPRFTECIRYAVQSGIKEVSFLSNGSMLSAEYFEKIMRAGASWITLSVDGLDGTYEKIRKPLKFLSTLEKIAEIKTIKERASFHKPVIKVQSVWPAIRENPEKYYNTFLPHTDLIAFNPLIDYLGKDEQIVYEEDFSCPQLYQRLVVGADGLVMMCSNDEENTVVVGDANHQRVCEIWRGRELNSVREIHRKRNGFMQIPVCKKCYLPRKTENSERAVVNGREIIVRNYINRQQRVGE